MIFALDVLSALTDLTIFIVSPKIENKRSRLKEARKADIETTHQQITENHTLEKSQSTTLDGDKVNRLALP